MNDSRTLRASAERSFKIHQSTEHSCQLFIRLARAGHSTARAGEMWFTPRDRTLKLKNSPTKSRFFFGRGGLHTRAESRPLLTQILSGCQADGRAGLAGLLLTCSGKVCVSWRKFSSVNRQSFQNEEPSTPTVPEEEPWYLLASGST